MDQAAYLKHLQSILKKFDPLAIPNKETLIRYFQDRLRSLIRNQLDRRGRQLDNQEEAIKKGIDIEAKAACQPQGFLKDIDSQCTRKYQPLRTDDFKKDVKTKKSPLPSPANYTSRQSSQPGHPPSISKLNKKNSRLCQSDNNCQQDRILATGVNLTTVKKDRKFEKKISQLECFNSYKKGHYIKQCPNKQPKN